MHALLSLHVMSYIFFYNGIILNIAVNYIYNSLNMREMKQNILLNNDMIYKAAMLGNCSNHRSCFEFFKKVISKSLEY